MGDSSSDVSETDDDDEGASSSLGSSEIASQARDLAFQVSHFAGDQLAGVAYEQGVPKSVPPKIFEGVAVGLMILVLCCCLRCFCCRRRRK